MANLQGIRRRIRSVKNMQQITKAMKLVSASKLRRAQDRVIAARPYSRQMAAILNHLAARAGDYEHPLLEKRGDQNILLVLITADKGLCGAFNTNLIRAAQQFLREQADKNVSLITVGRKGRDFFRRRGAHLVGEYINITARVVTYSQAAEIARDIIQRFTDAEQKIDKVYIIFNEFKSVLQQRVIVGQLLPLCQFQEGEQQETPVDYIYEQPPAEIFAELLPKHIETQVFHALLESVASEHGARMTAMDSASRNASEMIDSLTLYMNRVRQASITREIIEVVSGAEAL